MLVGNSFDLWETDAFFSAAEEVQHSADILESAYRTWVRVRQKNEGSLCSDLEEPRRQMQTALGTAKWQLEEFERAVGLSYASCQDQNRMARHQHFVAAMESQISRIQDALRASDGDKTLRWVNLDEDERYDLAMFLSGTNSTTQNRNLFKNKEPFKYGYSSNTSSGKDVTIDMNVKCKAEAAPEAAALKIVIPDRDDPIPIAPTPKGKKGLRASSCLQLFRCSSNLSNRVQSPRRPRLRLIIILMLSFFLLVPYFIQLS